MAIAFVGERGTRAVANGSGTIETVTVSANCTAGNTVILCFGARNTSTSGISVSDARGNTWTVDVGPVNTGNNLCFIASTVQDVAALQSGDLVTITCGTAPTNRMAWLQEFSGLLTSGTRKDKTASAGSGSNVSTGTGGTTAMTAHADELAIAAFTISVGSFGSYGYNATGTVGTYTAFTTDKLNANGSNAKSMLGCYQILDAAAAQVAAVNWTNANTFQGVIATYRTRTTPQRTLTGVG